MLNDMIPPSLVTAQAQLVDVFLTEAASFESVITDAEHLFKNIACVS
jgi:hypothetical protein